MDNVSSKEPALQIQGWDASISPSDLGREDRPSEPHQPDEIPIGRVKTDPFPRKGPTFLSQTKMETRWGLPCQWICSEPTSSRSEEG